MSIRSLVIFLIFVSVLPQPDSAEAKELRITFGSCIAKPQSRIWKNIVFKKPDLMLFLGDNVYTYSKHYSSAEKLRALYRKNFSAPGLVALRTKIPSFAIWSDHDFGPNNSDSTFELRALTLKVFREHWQNPSPPSELSESVAFALERDKIQILMTDDRTYRINPSRSQAGQLYGDKQLRWLKRRLSDKRFEVSIIASAGQLLAEKGDFESLAEYPKDQKQLYEAIRRAPSKVVIVSGDRHQAELLQRKLGDKTVYEITSSPLSAGLANLKEKKIVPHRLWRYRSSTNFGMLIIRETIIEARIYSKDGSVLLKHRLDSD